MEALAETKVVGRIVARRFSPAPIPSPRVLKVHHEDPMVEDDGALLPQAEVVYVAVDSNGHPVPIHD